MATKKKPTVSKKTTEEVGRVLAGLVGCGLLAAAADGDLADEEKHTIIAILGALTEGAGIDATEEQLSEIAGELAGDMVEQGADAVLKGLPHLLESEDERRLGAMAAAAVTAADGDVSRDEAETYYAIAKVLGFGRKDAEALWEEALSDDEG